jgi:UDP-glucose 4-epimerase
LKVVVIGYNGFIGSHLVSYFKSLGIDIICVGRCIEDPQSNKVLSFKDFFSIEKKIDFDIWINAAGSGNVQLSILNPEVDFTANVELVESLLKLKKRIAPSGMFIQFSSAAVYGNPRILPVKEDSLLNPISPYGYNKLLSENLCKHYAELYGIQSIILRPFSVYGPGLKKQLIWDVHKKFFQSDKKETIEFFGTGNETRDFIFIQDLCQMVELLIKQASDLSNFELFNVSNEEEVKIKTIIELIASKFEDKPFLFSGISREGDPDNWKGDNSRLKQLGYSRKHSLEQGLDVFTNWFLNSQIDK